MGRGMAKAERLQEMERLYLQRAYADIEMAERLGVDRTTVFRDRTALEEKAPFIQDEDGRYRIDRSRYVSNVRLDMSEALAMYLGARRLSQQTRYAQQSVASGLEKLAMALHQPMTERLVKAADRILSQEKNVARIQVFETVARAWIEGLQLRLSYRALRSEGAKRHLFSPYLLEPSPWGDGIYLIGFSDLAKRTITLRLDRIERASLSGPFSLPDDFDETEMLHHAWGIWGSDEEPAVVRLRFTGRRATRRLQESIWHPLEEVEPQPDGSVLWSAPIAQWREMLPWIRGWGSDVEALEPPELRQVLVRDASRLMEIYSQGPELPRHMLLWAKTDDDNHTHPLICHLIDVGQVALTLWENVLTDAFRTQIAGALGTTTSDAGRLFAFWAACHDLGKACPNFQRKFKPAQELLETAGYDFPPILGSTTCYHATISTLVLPELWTELTSLNLDLGKDIAQALGGHHGSWPTSRVLQRHRSQVGGQEWGEARSALLDGLIDVFEPAVIKRLGRDDSERNTVLVLLSGFTSVADWIGSMNEFFPFSTPHVTPKDYARTARGYAQRALKTLGWLDWEPPQEQLSFSELHGFAPRPAQAAVMDLEPGDHEPTLIIAEMLTGAGKTELALYLTDRWAAIRQQRGLYVAMPTQATSNQMYTRVGTYLRKRYPNQQVNFHLVHGAARWRDDLLDLELTTEDETELGTIRAQGWFLPRKRTLLAPFAVGTVDQALMSTLQTRHFFVRLFGLSGKTVIFDEVHAYDTYMNELFQRLLTWLRAVGTSVIVLSATLPASTRAALVKAWVDSDAEVDGLDREYYPCLTVASAQNASVSPLPRDEDRIVNIQWIGASTEAIAEVLRERLKNGGCAAVICNRVDRAQAVYAALAEEWVVDSDNLLLFHARTPGIWRNATEETVLARFGKGSDERPEKAIVVATQVIEQSLDLDFDLMVTDLAPIDLVLQRAGRLHRHHRERRPTGLEKPALLITQPELNESGITDFGGDEYVYEGYILLRSLWTILSTGESLRLPSQTTDLIEAVYGDESRLPSSLPTNASELLAQFRARMDSNEGKARIEAGKRLVAMPAHEDLLWLENDMLEEDDVQVHDSLKAMTRLMRPTINLVCLHGSADAQHVALDPDSLPEVDLKKEPSPELVKAIAQRVVTVSHPGVIGVFRHQNVPSGWRNHALLHTHYAVIFSDGVCVLPGGKYELRLARDIGLEIIRVDS